jgi:hypothetical protein
MALCNIHGFFLFNLKFNYMKANFLVTLQNQNNSF